MVENIVASGSGISYEVGKNCEKITKYTSNITAIFTNFFIYKIKYNNSKYGKFCLAGTLDFKSVTILSQNKDFNFQWELIENEDSGEFFIFGNHTKKTEKNSLAIVEVLQIEPEALKANKSKFIENVRKFKNDSELAEQIKKLRK